MSVMGAVLLAGVAACGSNSSGAAKASASEPYRITVLAALAGPLSVIADGEVQGMRAAVAVINHSGGILGRQIALTVQNDDGDPTTALNLVTSDVDSGTPPDLVVAGTDGSETDAVTPILTSHKIIDIDPTAPARSSQPSFAPYHFSSNTSAAAPNAAIVGELASEGYKHVAVLVPNDALGTLSLGEYEAAIKAAGMTAKSASYPPGGTDFSPELLQLQAGHPQALIIDAFGTDAATAITSRAKIGWHIPTIGDAPFSGSNVGALVPASDLTNVRQFVLSDDVYTPSARRSKGFAAFYSALKTELKGLPKLEIQVYSLGYDSVALAADAARQAHSTATPAMVKALLNLKKTSEPFYATFSYEHFDPSDRSLALAKGNYSFIPVSPAVGGLFNVPSGVNAA